MCGIVGVWSASGAPEVSSVTAMIAALAHRGPDGSGYFRDEHVALGHTRLAIVDTAGGVQPMCNEDEQIWVTFNGEIFNYVELMQTLKVRGHRFRTHSDTEVIVHAWEEWGTECFHRFNGQWALAIWDRRTRQLVLCRDRYGVRPLFYTRTGTDFRFASEIKALFADDTVVRELDPMGIGQALTFWSSVAPTTPFRGVNQLPPGSWLRVDETGTQTHRYWQPDFPARGTESQGSLTDNADQLREAVIAATSLRFERSDVPVGAYVSGGIDSAVTAGVIARHTGADLRTFSLRFTDDEFDEGEYQDSVRRLLGTRHSELVVTARDIADVFPDVVWHAENPLLRTAPAPMYLLSKHVHDEGYKVVVTGEGADEILAGYDIFREAKVRDFWARDPDSSTRARAIELLYPWMKRSPNLAPAFARGFFGKELTGDDPGRSHRPRWDTTGALLTMLTADGRSGDARGYADALLAGRPADYDGWDPLAQAQWLELTTLLPGYILSSQGDRMLMANSVEGRFPFLDVDIWTLMRDVPARQKILGLDEKHLLKQAFSDLVPPDVLNRPKQPYRAPDATSFFAEGEPDWLDAVTSSSAVSSAGIFSPSIVERLLAKCRAAGGRGLSNSDNMRLVAVLSIQLLHAQFVERRRIPSTRLPTPTAVFDVVGNGSRPGLRSDHDVWP